MKIIFYISGSQPGAMQEAHKNKKKTSKEAFWGRIFGLGGTRRKYNSDLSVRVPLFDPLSKNLLNAHPPTSFMQCNHECNYLKREK
jgi:hypothetical protein